MSIQDQRSQSLNHGTFNTFTRHVSDCVNLRIWDGYTYTTTQGRLTREKPLLSVLRWLKQPKETLRLICIKNRRLFV